MLAVVLSVGLVVDDAIVMTENIYIRIERGMSPKEAGIEGAKEIFFAVISTSITLIAVFFPIVFMEGMTGRLFREFSLVISGAVVISTFAALTITPMPVSYTHLDVYKRQMSLLPLLPQLARRRIEATSLSASLRKGSFESVQPADTEGK